MADVSAADVDQVRRLFNPRSVALIGATDKSRWSWSIFGNLALHGFAGPVYLVNPRGVPVHGRDSYRSVADLPEPVDLAFVMVPTSAVLGVLTEVADAGIPSVVLLTSGFAEVGEEGAELERQVVELARRRGLTILGPNGNGFINAAARITPYGLPIDDPLLSGPVGVVLQSGALASSVLTFAQTRNVGVSLLVSMGNESMVSMTDVMRYLIDDDATRVIALFIESVRHTGEFIALAREALATGKPVVAIKVGRSQTGARVARAHTGSLVGDDAVVDAVFSQHGVIRVDSLEDLIITAGLLAATGPLPGNRFGFVTASGGASEIIADRAEDEGIEIPEFAPETVERLRQVVPEFAATQNPVDVTGYILVDRNLQRNALTAVHDDPSLDALVLVSDLPRTLPADPTLIIDGYRQTGELIRRSAKPIVVMGVVLTDITPVGRDVASQTGYPGRARRHPPRPDRARPGGALVGGIPGGAGRAGPGGAGRVAAGAAGRPRRLLVGVPRLRLRGRARDPGRARRARDRPDRGGRGRQRARVPRRRQARRRRDRAQERHRRGQGRAARPG